MIDLPSPNVDSRPAGIDTLVLHYTGMQSGQAAIDRLRDPEARVSSHYVVEEDGTVFRLVPEHQRAWHAGVSFWRGRHTLNDVSIGIEIVNPGHEWGYRAFPPAQIQAVIALCQAILARHPIPPHNVVAHSDIAPTRKQDPGELFPWQHLAKCGIGLWPHEAGEGQGAPPWTNAKARAALATIGYDMSDPTQAALAAALTAFQRHWAQENVTGRADPPTTLRLAALLRMVPPTNTGVLA